jgi:hypothetical protein
MDFLWGRTERRRREYDWSEYDELTAGLERRGIPTLVHPELFQATLRSHSQIVEPASSGGDFDLVRLEEWRRRECRKMPSL